MDVGENQLTVLLGFNGAGKTTLMDLITGIQPMNKGSIFINKNSIRAKPIETRRMIGLCPQENIFYAELTVKNNLQLAGALRGVPMSLLANRINLIVENLGLKEKLNEKAKNLSGGMKRRLCLGCSFIGYNEVLVFDEPTSGLDPETRRQLWNVFIQLRKFRTIFLTTHFMEEADVLGDKIAILNQGKLICYGSPAFLKKAYNTGYLLKVAVEIDHNKDDILNLILNFVSNATLINSKKNELDFRIPTFDFETNSSLNRKISDLFCELEKNKQQLKIISFGLNNTSLEDVFIKAGETGTETSQSKSPKSLSNAEISENFVENLDKCLEKQSVSFWQQAFAVFLKRFTYQRRSFGTIFFQFVIPMILLFLYYNLVSLTVNSLTETSENHNLKDIISQYPQRNVFFFGNLNQPKVLQRGELFKSALKKTYDIDVIFFNKTFTSPDEFSNWTKSDEYGDDDYRFMGGITCQESGDNVYEYVYLNLYYTWIFSALINLPLETSSTTVNFNYNVIYSFDEILDRNNGNSIFIFGVHTALFLLPFVFILYSFMKVPSSEISRRSILIQKIAGLSYFRYWYLNLLYDWFMFCFFSITALSIVLFIISFYIDILNIFSFKDHLFQNLVILNSTIISFIVQTYLLSAFKISIAFSLIVMLVLLFITGAASNGIFFYFFLNKNRIIGETLQLLIYIVFPSFNLIHYFSKLLFRTIENINESFIKGGGKYLTYKYENDTLFGIKSLRLHLYCALASLILYLTCLIFLDHTINLLKQTLECLKALSRLCCSKLRKRKTEQDRMEMQQFGNLGNDARVHEEERLVEDLVYNRNFSERTLIVKQLQKFYGQFEAVKKISFTVQKNECFGLLGLNGAGKTTTFSMLTGDEAISSGEIYLFGQMVQNKISLAYESIAYCPQIECNFEGLTVKDTLKYYARLIGMPNTHINQIIKKLLELTDLTKYTNYTSDTLSGGNKRKLSLAISLINGKSLTFLDEPTTAIDPVARRKIWKTLNMFKSSHNKSLVLTSHSMDECEFLCNRIAIMAYGKLVCLGTYSELRDTYAQGFKLHIRLHYEKITDTSYTNDLTTDVLSLFPNSELKDFHLNSMIFYIKETKANLVQLFRMANDLEEKWKFDDFTLTETTLEEIFLSFSKRKDEQSKKQKTNAAKSVSQTISDV